MRLSPLPLHTKIPNSAPKQSNLNFARIRIGSSASYALYPNHIHFDNMLKPYKLIEKRPLYKHDNIGLLYQHHKN